MNTSFLASLGVADPNYQPGQQQYISPLAQLAQYVSGTTGVQPDQATAAPLMPVDAAMLDGTPIPSRGQEGTSALASLPLQQPQAPQREAQPNQPSLSAQYAQPIEDDSPSALEKFGSFVMGGPSALRDLDQRYALKKLGSQIGGVAGQLLQVDPSPETFKMVAAAALSNKPEAQSTLGKLAYDYKRGLIDENTYKAGIAKENGLTQAPLTDAGKLNADLASGRITPDQFNSEVKKLTNGKYSEVQLNAASFANRMKGADQIINDYETGGEGGTPKINLVNKTAAALNVIPDSMGGSYLANEAMSPDQQKYTNAATQWIRANLRKESGAAIGKDEMASEFKNYFPQPGDDPEVIAQKRALRATTQASVQTQSNGAYDNLFGGNSAPQPAQVAAKPTPEQARAILEQRKARNGPRS